MAEADSGARQPRPSLRDTAVCQSLQAVYDRDRALFLPRLAAAAAPAGLPLLFALFAQGSNHEHTTVSWNHVFYTVRPAASRPAPVLDMAMRYAAPPSLLETHALAQSRVAQETAAWGSALSPAPASSSPGPVVTLDMLPLKVLNLGHSTRDQYDAYLPVTAAADVAACDLPGSDWQWLGAQETTNALPDWLTHMQAVLNGSLAHVQRVAGAVAERQRRVDALEQVPGVFFHFYLFLFRYIVID